MTWFRNWFAPRAPRSTPSVPADTFRPQVESLDERCLPSVSSVLTGAGLSQFVVDNTNSLVLNSPVIGGTGTIVAGATTPVRTAQGFRTAAGGWASTR